MTTPAGAPFDFARVFASAPVLLAPMEDVTDAAFRAVCRARGASLCVTEFVHAEGLRDGDPEHVSKLRLTAEDTPTAVQIYGGNAASLVEAAELVDATNPAFIDINAGCWVPKVVREGAGAAWLRDPDALVRMAAAIVRVVKRPVTVKTRIGLGDEARLPIVELVERLADVGVRAVTIHCRTAQQGHDGAPDWSWATRAVQATSLPVIVNGGITSARDAKRALESTGAAGVMIGRRAIAHPWIFREVAAALRGESRVGAPSADERVATYRAHLTTLAASRGPRRALHALKRHAPGYLAPWGPLAKLVAHATHLDEALDRLDALPAPEPTHTARRDVRA